MTAAELLAQTLQAYASASYHRAALPEQVPAHRSICLCLTVLVCIAGWGE